MAATAVAVADDLRLILGIGPVNAATLNAAGVTTFEQLASLTVQQIQDIMPDTQDARVEREDWIGQARILAAGGTTDHAERVRKGEISSTPDGKPTSA